MEDGGRESALRAVTVCRAPGKNRRESQPVGTATLYTPPQRNEDTWGLAWPPLLSSPASSASEQEEEEESGESTGFEEEDEETEEDRAFIDDNELEDEGLSFYRRVDLEWALDLAPLTAVRRDPTPPPNGWRKKPNSS